MTSEQEYLTLLQRILDEGKRVPNRTGTDTIRILGTQSRYDLTKGFPLFTTKKVWFKGVVHELLWMLSGSTNIKYLVDNGVNIWNDDAYRHYIGQVGASDPIDGDVWLTRLKGGETYFGRLGPVYGKQWRKWQTNTICEDRVIVRDQVADLVRSLKVNPASRRHILSAWNVADVPYMGLPPCHVMSQYTVDDGLLHCHMYQRSADFALGIPFNVASYALLTHILAQVCELKAGVFIHTVHDAHIYVNQVDGIKEQLTRKPFPLPTLTLNPDIKNIDDFKYDDIKVIDYKCHSKISMPLST